MRKHFCVIRVGMVMMALALVVGSLSAAAQSVATEHRNAWEAWAGWSSCDYNNGTQEYKCKFNDGNRPTATIRITNPTGSDVRLTYREFHGGGSDCSTSPNPIVDAAYLVQANRAVELDVLSGGSNIGCRLGFVLLCDQKDGSGNWKLKVPCRDVVTVEYRQWKGNKQ
jgi:hypothetical protein